MKSDASELSKNLDRYHQSRCHSSYMFVNVAMNDWDQLSSDDDEKEICACLLREKCFFDEEKHSMKTSMHICMNFRKRQCMNKLWGPCLETATDHQSMYLFIPRQSKKL